MTEDLEDLEDLSFGVEIVHQLAAAKHAEGYKKALQDMRNYVEASLEEADRMYVEIVQHQWQRMSNFLDKLEAGSS